MAIRFINILKDLILETSRFEFIYNKYTKNKEGNSDEISIDTLIELINSDPTSKIPEKINKENLTTQDMESIRVGKYTQWIIKNYVYSENKDLFLEDLYKVTGDLMKFERFKNRLPQEYRDINKLTVDELYNQVKDFSLEKTKATTEEKKEASKTYQHPGGEIIYRGSQWTVVRISNQGQLGKDAACFYGGYHLEPQKGETRWCTSSPGLNFFDRYIKDGPIYVVIPNSPTKFTGDMEVGEKTGLPALRYQFHFPSNQFMDPADKRINIVDFIKKDTDFKELFRYNFLKNIFKNNNDGHVNITDSDTEFEYVKIYGIDEYLDNIDKDIKSFNFTVPKTHENFDFERIGNFRNLEEVTIQNGLENIPNSFCNLKNLKYLNLLYNQNIKIIPECLSQLPNLKLISLSDTNNLIIPEKIKERFNISKNLLSIKNNQLDFFKDKTKNQILQTFLKYGLEQTGFDYNTLAKKLGIETSQQFLDLLKNIKVSSSEKKGRYDFYFYPNNKLMSYNEKEKILFLNKENLYNIFSEVFGLDNKEVNIIFKNWMKINYGFTVNFAGRVDTAILNIKK